MQSSNNFKYLLPLSMVWVSILILGFFTSIKTFTLFQTTFAVSIIAYPFTYLFNDIFTEVYGYKETRKIVWTGFFCVLLVTLFASLYSYIPSSIAFLDNTAFDLIFRASPIVAILGIIAFFTGEFVNSFIVAKLKLITKNKLKWLRWISSTFFGQIFDNSIFFIGAVIFVGWYSWGEVFSLIVSSVLFCTIWEIISLPLTYKITNYLKAKENSDVYDNETNFNPFIG